MYSIDVDANDETSTFVSITFFVNYCLIRGATYHGLSFVSTKLTISAILLLNPSPFNCNILNEQCILWTIVDRLCKVRAVAEVTPNLASIASDVRSCILVFDVETDLTMTCRWG